MLTRYTIDITQERRANTKNRQTRFSTCDLDNVRMRIVWSVSPPAVMVYTQMFEFRIITNLLEQLQ